MVQWLGLRAFTAEGPGSVPGQGTKIPQAARHGQKKLPAIAVSILKLLKLGNTAHLVGVSHFFTLVHCFSI